jgi:hypothetical protein
MTMWTKAFAVLAAMFVGFASTSAQARDTADVFIAGMPDNVVGTSTWHKMHDAVVFDIDTTMLIAGNAYSVWLAIFNNPKYCVDGCNGADLPGSGGNPLVNGSLIGLTGGVAQSDVQGFQGIVELGPTGLIGRTVLQGRGLVDPNRAEMHVIIADHGAVAPEDILAEITSPAPASQVAVHLPKAKGKGKR